MSDIQTKQALAREGLQLVATVTLKDLVAYLNQAAQVCQAATQAVTADTRP